MYIHTYFKIKAKPHTLSPFALLQNAPELAAEGSTAHPARPPCERHPQQHQEQLGTTTAIWPGHQHPHTHGDVFSFSCSPLKVGSPKTRQRFGDITSWVRVTPRDPWHTTSTYRRVPCRGSGLGFLLGYFQQLRNGSWAPSSLSSKNSSRLPACPAIPGRGMGMARSHRSFRHRSQARSDLSSPRPTLQPCSSALPHFQSLQTRESLHTKTIPPQRETRSLRAFNECPSWAALLVAGSAHSQPAESPFQGDT